MMLISNNCNLKRIRSDVIKALIFELLADLTLEQAEVIHSKTIKYSGGGTYEMLVIMWQLGR